MIRRLWTSLCSLLGFHRPSMVDNVTIEPRRYRPPSRNNYNIKDGVLRRGSLASGEGGPADLQPYGGAALSPPRPEDSWSPEELSGFNLDDLPPEAFEALIERVFTRATLASHYGSLAIERSNAFADVAVLLIESEAPLHMVRRVMQLANEAIDAVVEA